MLNERAQLPELLTHLRTFAAESAEIVLVDGGSEDDSVAYARAAGFLVLNSARGRARQMNAGADVASGAILLFLHADTRLAPDALAQVRAAIRAERCWGRFNVRITGTNPSLAVVARMMNWRSCLSGIATGDQAIFVGKAAFVAVGGFPEQPLMEDIELSKRLKRLARPLCLPGPVLTSGRRWQERGVWRTILLMWRLRWAYWRGASAEVIAERYR